MRKIILIFTLMLSIVATSYGKTTYLQVGVTPTLNLMSGETVKGLRIPILFGTTEKVVGVDFNMLAGDVDEFTGLQGGVFLGAGIVNKVNKKFRGVGLGLANIHGGDSKGLLIGPYNMTTDFKGLKIGIINYSKNSGSYELGVINNSKKAFFQLGVLNFADEIDGIQIGLINFAKNGVLPVMPFVNFNWRL
ncbi:MAG: hypothetical protein KAH04_00920 [Psychrilyobacter sp.]|nr:hypothetical protein [Psychrilyobacter sp.]